MKRFISFLSLFLFLLPLLLFAQTPRKETRTFAVKEGQDLKLDIYSSSTREVEKTPCLIFVFGGGFKEGSRDWEYYTDYFQYFSQKGFTVISIDYRLGMKGQKAPSIFNRKPMIRSIEMAVSDLYSATNYVLKHAEELNIDSQRIIISGSSAGAITVLQADYELRNNKESDKTLPQDFRYAGVISFAGSIYSTEGLPSYLTPPAPTLFFHGSADKLVPYGSTRFFKIGMFGSKPLTKRFREQGYPYQFYSMQDMGHDVSEYPMKDFLPEIERFVRDFIFDKKLWMMDINLKDKLRQSDTGTNPGNYYK